MNSQLTNQYLYPPHTKNYTISISGNIKLQDSIQRLYEQHALDMQLCPMQWVTGGGATITHYSKKKTDLEPTT